MHKILLIEDSEDSYHLVARALGNQFYIVWAKNSKEGYEALAAQPFDMILLDVVLPDGDGFQIGSQLQNDAALNQVPLIFITGQTTLSDKVLGFSIGADDYICKPFEPLELKARVESKLKRAQNRQAVADIKRYGDIEVDLSSQRAFLVERDAKNPIDLTPIEFKLLLRLCRDVNKVVSRDDLLKSVWGENIHVYNRSVDTHISKLRKKLGTKSDYIRSVHGTGYQLSLNS